MRAHLRYLRYVWLHKCYVFRAGWMLREQVQLPRWRWLWRLLVHDWSKLTPAEWGPYVQTFYGLPAPGKQHERKAAFDRAWLHHLHRNPHHWQHWILHEDSGKVLVLVPHSAYIDEMLADWLAAGPKVLRRPTMAYCVAETIAWYAEHHQHMTLRDAARTRVEMTLLHLASKLAITDAVRHIESAQRARSSILLPFSPN